MTRSSVAGIVAVVAAVFLWTGAGLVALTSFDSVATWQSPGKADVWLEPGTWMLFEQVPQSGSNAVTPNQVAEQRTMTVDNFSVLGPQGATLPLTCVYCDASKATATPLDLKLYNTVASFEVKEAGSYQLNAQGANAAVAVGNPYVTITAVTPWLTVMSGIGGILFAAGVVLIVRSRRRKAALAAQPVAAAAEAEAQSEESAAPRVTPSQVSATAPAPPPGHSPPPGWYPNPYLPGTTSEMWWNGKEWTSNWR
ncbi:MAG: hypothetical protein ACOYD0_10785 [Candidatus Nanopelagicales bacterium]